MRFFAVPMSRVHCIHWFASWRSLAAPAVPPNRASASHDTVDCSGLLIPVERIGVTCPISRISDKWFGKDVGSGHCTRSRFRTSGLRQIIREAPTASVGTILPKRRGHPVAGWPFHFSECSFLCGGGATFCGCSHFGYRRLIWERPNNPLVNQNPRLAASACFAKTL